MPERGLGRQTHLEGPAGVDGHVGLLPHVALIATEGPRVRVQGSFVPRPDQEVEGACGGREERGPVRSGQGHPPTHHCPQHGSCRTGLSPVTDWFGVRSSAGVAGLTGMSAVHQDNLQIFFHFSPSFPIS